MCISVLKINLDVQFMRLCECRSFEYGGVRVRVSHHSEVLLRVLQSDGSIEYVQFINKFIKLLLGVSPNPPHVT